MSKKTATWQQALSSVVSSPTELISALNLDQDLTLANKASTSFPLKVPQHFLDKIEPGNLNDPLLKQILPTEDELEFVEGYSKDPLKETEANPVPGLLHKYKGRVLITLTSACAIHCRYCFRRYFPYDDNNPGTVGWQKILDYIAGDDSIIEIILSGGDPLTISDKLLQRFCENLAKIPHVKRVRIHSRVPVVLPVRITNELMAMLSTLPLQFILVIHVNHPAELDDEVRRALNKFRQANIPLLNQTVLLKGVNDNSETLISLSESLFAAGVLPYYLHVLDKIQGAQHFDMPLSQAKSLHKEMMKSLPGYLIPRLVCEEPGACSKTTLSS